MRFTLILRGPGALRRAPLPPSSLALGEAFVRGDLDVEGDLEAARDLALSLATRLSSPHRLGRVLGLLLRLPREQGPTPAGQLLRARRPWSPPHTRERDGAAIRHYYDVGNEFYRLWLDAEAVYSCGYFPPGVDEIDAAQRAKLDYIWRKLRLRPGERFLDIGCGWGGLIRHAARHYGVQALGVTLSPAQAQLAHQRILADDSATAAESRFGPTGISRRAKPSTRPPASACSSTSGGPDCRAISRRCSGRSGRVACS